MDAFFNNYSRVILSLADRPSPFPRLTALYPELQGLAR
jgi:hypothetical protein